jgi:hypothetical protein
MKTYKNILLAVAFLILMSGTTFGIGKTSARSGLFHSGSTWTDGIPPEPGDDITILKDHGVGNASGTIGSLLVEGGLSLFSGTKLTVKRNLRVAETGSITHPSSGSLILLGTNLTNDGQILAYAYFNGERNQHITGSGKWKGGGEFNAGGLTAIGNMTVTAGQWLVNSEVGVERKWLVIDSGIRKSASGTVFSLTPVDRPSGEIEFQGGGFLASDESAGNPFNAFVSITSGTRNCLSGSISSPLRIGSGARLTTPADQTYFGLRGYTNIEVGGTLGGRGIYFSGKQMHNRGLVNPNVLTFDGNGGQSLSGDGEWKPINGFVFSGSGAKSLANSITIESDATLKLNSSLNLNGHTLTLERCSLSKYKTAKVEGEGKVVFKGGGQLYSDESLGNLFNSSVEIVENTTSVPSSSGISGMVTVDGGAVLNVYPNKTLAAKNNVEVKPGGTISGATLTFKGKRFVNDGNVSCWIVNFAEGEQHLSGTGKFSGNTFYVNDNTFMVLDSNHQFRSLVLKDEPDVPGASSLDIRNQTLKVRRAFTVPAASKTLTEGSTVEYNGDDMAQSVATKIDYYYLTINNTNSSVSLSGKETVKNNLKLENGVFIIGTDRLTVCGETIKINGSFNGTPTGNPCLEATTNASNQ